MVLWALGPWLSQPLGHIKEPKTRWGLFRVKIPKILSSPRFSGQVGKTRKVLKICKFAKVTKICKFAKVTKVTKFAKFTNVQKSQNSRKFAKVCRICKFFRHWPNNSSRVSNSHLKNVVIYKETKWEKGCNVIWNNLFGEGWNENSEILFKNAFSLCVLEWDVLRTQKSE